MKPTGHSTVYNIVDLPSSFTNGHSSNDFHYDCSWLKGFTIVNYTVVNEWFVKYAEIEASMSEPVISNNV